MRLTMLLKRLMIYLVPMLLLLGSCGDSENGDKDDNGPDQDALLQNIGNNLILKGYENLATATSALEQSAATFTNDVTKDNLNALRTELEAAWEAWQKVGFYDFGPAENNAMLSINLYPTDTEEIEQNIEAGQGSYNLSAAGAGFVKGFPALDYLLFGYGDNDDDIVSKYTGNSNARTYLMDVVTDIATIAGNVHDAWSPDGGNYVATFNTNTGTSVGSSLSLLVNAWSEYTEVHIRNAKIGIPNGNNVATSERFGPFPEKTEAYYSRTSLSLAKTTMQAYKNFYLGIDQQGNDREGIYDYLNKLNAQNGTLADDFTTQIEAVQADLNGLNGTLVEAIGNQGDDVTEAFNGLKATVALLKVDIVSALSISITYADNDGD